MKNTHAQARWDKKWRQIGGSISLDGPAESPLIDLMQRKQKEFYECLGHEVDNAVLNFSGRRRYQRGKNRCMRCGLKIVVE